MFIGKAQYPLRSFVIAVARAATINRTNPHSASSKAAKALQK
jgi:hypothetical protein